MEDNFIIQISARGEALGLEMTLPLLQWLLLFRREHPKATLDDAVDKITGVLKRQIRRAKENKDGTMDMDLISQVHDFEKIVNNLLKNHGQNRK